MSPESGDGGLRIAVFEDQKSFLAQLAKFLHYMEDFRPSIDLTDLREIEDLASWRQAVQGCSLALVDLELSGSFGHSPNDYDGLETVLPRLREAAPWLPAVLMSVYFVHSHMDLFRVAEGDFDAILPKDVFKACNAEEWHRFCQAVTINRIAATTARSVKVVRDCYESSVPLEKGRGVEKLFESLGEADIRDAIKLMGLGRRIVLDLVSPGFSGLSVVKATVSDGERDARWLLKIGRRLDKLVQECDAHIEMLVDGYARRMSAPLLYRVPIAWNGCGVIAYEFEEHSEPLREFFRNTSPTRAIEAIMAMLKRFWNPVSEVQIIPRAALDFRGLVANSSEEPDDCATKRFASLVAGGDDNPLLDRSVAALIGRQHGDLHGLNILISNGAAMMIDFAHYRGRDRRGIPFLDVVKLAFDLWAFGSCEWTAESLLQGSAFETGPLAILLGGTGLKLEGVAHEDVARFTRLACVAEGGRYIGYPDVPLERRKELIAALDAYLNSL